jgi:hypothetical protein
MFARTLLAVMLASSARGADVQVLRQPHDPYGAPRPAPGQEHVPLRTTLYIELGVAEKGSTDPVLPESVAIELQPDGGSYYPVLSAGRRFADGATGRFLPVSRPNAGPVLAAYLELANPLRAATGYTIRVAAKTRGGAVLKADAWRFKTEAGPEPTAVDFDLTLADKAARWHGGFFTGVCNVAFCSSHANRVPTFDLMAQVRKTAPRAWSLQRDFWLTGTEHRPQLFSHALPNIVRERETRRVTAIDEHPDGRLLKVEDFFGHEQYGVPSGRPVSGDYRPGDEVIVTDGVHNSKAKVVKADDTARTVLVSGLETPKGGWKLGYDKPLPKKEDLNAPGLFPPGGCHLIKFRPHGTPVYYWGRLDKEWDLSVRTYGRRVMPNFADAPGDISADGRPWTTAKDYAQLHEVVRTIAGHVIDRYGDAALSFPWSVFNEPDLGAFFWRSDWDELQKFYDYATDAVLRAFEDRGYDSGKVFIGGLELGGIFGTNLKLREFLAHCSPRAKPVKGALPLNAAFADKRLDGKRSKRVEALCRASAGRGAPCDFVSVHAYNRSKTMADKLARAKEAALEIDAEYYAKLWVNSHEACPGWSPPPDPAYRDSYLGNGYFPTWCADVTARQLRRAAADPRYGYGESILTVWPAPPKNFDGTNDVARAIRTADGRTVTVASPILHFLGLLARMGPEFHVLPERTAGGHVVSGFASRDGETVRVLLYAHNALDTESRSAAEFDVSVRLAGLPRGKASVSEYRFDKDHNSYFRLAQEQRDRPAAVPDPDQEKRLAEALRDMESDEAATQLAGLEKLAALGPAAAPSAGAIFQLAQRTADDRVKEKAGETLKQVTTPRGYPAEVVKKVEELSALRQTGSSVLNVGETCTATVKVRVAGNGAAVLEIKPE